MFEHPYWSNKQQFNPTTTFSDVGIDMMYTTDELGKMNGAKMLPTLKSALAEELEKRVNL